MRELNVDGGTEFMSHRLFHYFNAKGIRRTISNKGTPQHNGIVERSNRTIDKMATAMLHHAKLPLTFWPEAVPTAVYIRN